MSIEWNNFFAGRTKHISGSQIRQFFALTERAEVISFAGGFPGNDFFPLAEIASTLSKLVLANGRQSLQYGPTEGLNDLRRLLAEKMNQGRMPCKTDNLIITDGSQQGIDLLSRILVNPGDPVLIEEPAYIGGMSAIKSYGGQPVGIAMDQSGPLPAVMENKVMELIKAGKKPKLFYSVPNFQNPTGITTSLERRREILAVANKLNLIIIEDDPYGNLCYEGRVPLNYKALDVDDRVVYLGSYSKVLIPGIRIGWIAGPQPLIEKAALAKQTTDLCSSSLGQQLVIQLIEEGFIDRHIELLKEQYRIKRDVMLESMQKYFPPEIQFSKPEGGFFIWVIFPDYFPPAKKLLELSLKYNVAFVHGEGFSSNGGGSHSARFSFSQPNLNEIISGIRTFGNLLFKIKQNEIHRGNLPADSQNKRASAC